MRVAHGKQVLETLDEVVAPQHTALVMLDMINDFLSPGGRLFNPQATDIDKVLDIIPRIARLLNLARKKGALPIYVQNTFLPHGADLPAGYIYFLDRRGVSLGEELPTLEGSWGAETIPQLRPGDGEPVITKRSYSGFLDTRLDAVLKANDIKTIVITGASSYGCIVTTALEGFCYGYYVVVPRECTAGTIRDWHQAAMTLMGPLLVNYDDVLQVWEKSGRSCACGCGGHTFARFVPGHDSKLRSLVNQVADGRQEPSAIPQVAYERLDACSCGAPDVGGHRHWTRSDA